MLRDNPFYVLNVPMSASRREIAAKTEEQSFLFDPDVCNEAQACLTNPAKRVTAEIGWFPGESEDTITAVRESIDRDQDVDASSLGINGKLNSILDSFTRHKQDAETLMENINTIDVYFDINDAESLLNDINGERRKAGIAETDLASVQQGLLQSRENIRTLITEKFAGFDDQAYVDIVSRIAESCLASADMSHGVIVDDVINQYELRMHPVIEAKTKQLTEYMEAIRKQTSASYRSTQTDSFIKLLKQWDRYVQPLQLRTQAEGFSHTISQNVAFEARDLAITLHNDYHDVSNATKIIDALNDVFAELPELITVLNNDKKTLEENKRAAYQNKNMGYAYGGGAQNTNGNKSSVLGDLLGLLLRIAIRFWWIILILIFALGDCDGSTPSSSSSTSDSSSSSSYEDTYDDYDPYANLVEQEMPENEHKFVNIFGDNRPSQIIVENPTDYAYVMKFEDASGETVFSFFVRPQSTTPMYMGIGTYYLKWAAGKTWYGEKDLFGPDTVYQKDPESWPFESGKYWTLTMQPVTNGNVHSNSIDADDF